MVEVVVTLGLIALIFACLITSINSAAGLNKINLITQQCISAAQAQLDSIAVTGGPISDRDFQRLWPNLNVSIEELPGSNQWQGLKLVKVSITAIKAPKEIKIRKCRYYTIQKEN